MWIGVIVMSLCILIMIQDIENIEVAQEAEDGGGQHIYRFLYDLFVYYSSSGLSK